MTNITIYHNPRCSKSRRSLALLQEHGIEPEIIEYLSTPPSSTALKNLLSLLEMTPRELLRNGEAAYKEHDLKDDSLTDQQLIDTMIAHPKLIERPIVVSGKQAVIGRPPERVLELLA